jgi:RimJ/RimL family protein N-acetyltransferase
MKKNVFFAPQTLESERLFFNCVCLEDAEEIYKNIDFEIINNLDGRAPWPYTQQDAIKFINNCQHAALKGWCYDYVIREKISQTFIGLVSLHVSQHENCIRPGQIGCWITKSQRNKGYALEVLQQIFNTAQSLGLKEIWAPHGYDNMRLVNLFKRKSRASCNTVDFHEDNETMHT